MYLSLHILNSNFNLNYFKYKNDYASICKRLNDKIAEY